jgi:hypothetical protein
VAAARLAPAAWAGLLRAGRHRSRQQQHRRHDGAMAGGAASAWLYSRSVHCGCCSRLARRPSKPDDTELDTLLGPDGASGGASGASGGAAGAGVDAHATAVRQLLPAFWRHFWPFLKASWRGRALAGATLLMCLLSAGLSSEFCRHAALLRAQR